MVTHAWGEGSGGEYMLNEGGENFCTETEPCCTSMAVPGKQIFDSWCSCSPQWESESRIIVLQDPTGGKSSSWNKQLRCSWDIFIKGFHGWCDPSWCSHARTESSTLCTETLQQEQSPYAGGETIA